VKYVGAATLPLHIAAEEAWMSINGMQPARKRPRAADAERYTQKDFAAWMMCATLYT
jgi:hypothetical protein